MARSLTPDPALGAALRRLREERGLTQEGLAYRAGLTAGSYARIELAQAAPAWCTVCQIARALEVSMVELARALEDEP